MIQVMSFLLQTETHTHWHRQRGDIGNYNTHPHSWYYKQQIVVRLMQFHLTNSINFAYPYLADEL